MKHGADTSEAPLGSLLPLLARNSEAFASALLERRALVRLYAAEEAELEVSEATEQPPLIEISLPAETPPQSETEPLGQFKLLLLRGLGRLLEPPNRDRDSRRAPPRLPPAGGLALRLLQDGWTEGRLLDRLAGAARTLEPARKEAFLTAQGEELEPVFLPGLRGFPRGSVSRRLLSLLYLEARGSPPPPSTDLHSDDPKLDLLAAVRRLGPSLRATLETRAEEELAEWVRRVLLPMLAELERESEVEQADEDQERGLAGGGARPTETKEHRRGGWPPEGSEEGEEEQQGEEEPDREGRAASGAAASSPRPSPQQPEEPDQGTPWPPGSAIPVGGGRQARRPPQARMVAIRYPTMEGGEIADMIAVVHGRSLAPSERVQTVLDDLAQVYGPRALRAFAPHAEALRRAFVVNYEERFGGRYRSGRRVGLPNLRRYMVSEDLRLFQKLRVPERLSYYFHLLVDVSPSMFVDRNAQKAIGLAYAFAHSLVRLGLPVDVTLYSSALTQLHEHEIDRLDLYFGGSFGYLSAGTREVEAIAYARQHAEFVPEERKLILVLTDGHPNTLAAERAGSPDLTRYYSERLVPWLGAAGIDLVGLVIGGRARYHPRAVSLNSGWDSLGALIDILEEMIARGRSSHDRLWA